MQDVLDPAMPFLALALAVPCRGRRLLASWLVRRLVLRLNRKQARPAGDVPRGPAAAAPGALPDRRPDRAGHDHRGRRMAPQRGPRAADRAHRLPRVAGHRHAADHRGHGADPLPGGRGGQPPRPAAPHPGDPGPADRRRPDRHRGPGQRDADVPRDPGPRRRAAGLRRRDLDRGRPRRADLPGQRLRRHPARLHGRDPGGRRGGGPEGMGPDRGDHPDLRGGPHLGRPPADPALDLLHHHPVRELDPAAVRGHGHRGVRPRLARPGRGRCAPN